ncbi:MAG: efflux RND transporter periplasmic adaptor subunit [Candidatus Alcyoniella australis]|nr:efflux RND transporter periplasmic adaptor subunit [Candidatus Alcyoniella australis]
MQIKFTNLPIAIACVLALVAFSASGCPGPPQAGKASQPHADQAPVKVRATTIAAQPFSRIIEFSGSIEAVNDVTVISETAGRVVIDRLEIGARVKKGDALVSVDSEPYRIELDAAQAAVSQATVGLEQAQDQLDRAGLLHDKQLISDADFDQIKYAQRNAQAVLESAEAKLSLARRSLRNATVRAPFDGVIADDLVSLGDTLGQGTAVAQLVDPGQLQLMIGVGQEEIDAVQPGMEARLSIPTLGESELRANVARVGVKALEPTMTYPVQLELIDPPDSVRVGMIATVQIPVLSIEQAFSVPIDAVFQRYGKSYVFLIDNGAVREQQVTPGPQNGRRVVLQDGVEAGDAIVTVGNEKLNDGSTVEVVE